MLEKNDSPIFIVGCGRSGTTLLRVILNRHSRIAIPEETWFFPDLHNKLNTLFNSEDWRESIAAYLHKASKLHFPELQQSEIRDGLNGIEKEDIPDIIATINRAFASRENKSRWGDKTPGYVLHIPFLKEMYPKAKVIHIIRDGRDVVPSLLRYWSVGPQTNSFIETAIYWKQQVKAGMISGSKVFGENYFEIKYENLIDQPEKVIKQVCEFIDEKFELTMLKPKSSASKLPDWEWHAKVKDDIDKSHKTLWADNLSSYQRGIMFLVAGKLLSNLDYPKDLILNVQSFFSFIEYWIKNMKTIMIYRLKVFVHNIFYYKNVNE